MMKLKYYLRGLGIGILVTVLLLTITSGKRGTMTDEEIKERARALGMSESGVLADMATPTPDAAGTPETTPKTEETPTPTPAATPTRRKRISLSPQSWGVISNSNPDPYAHPDGDANSNPDSDTHSDTHSDTNTHPDTCANGGRYGYDCSQLGAEFRCGQQDTGGSRTGGRCKGIRQVFVCKRL